MVDITTEELTKRLRLRFSAPQWMLCEEFAVGSHHGDKDMRDKPVHSRRVDAMAHAMNPYKPYIFGFEIKVLRSDWLNELRDPEKSRRFRPHCNAWYVVSPLKGVVKKDELPEDWGWIATHGDHLAIKVRAPWNDEPEHCPAIMAAFLRQSYVGSFKMQQQYRSDGWQDGYEFALREARRKKNG